MIIRCKKCGNTLGYNEFMGGICGKCYNVVDINSITTEDTTPKRVVKPSPRPSNNLYSRSSVKRSKVVYNKNLDDTLSLICLLLLFMGLPVSSNH